MSTKTDPESVIRDIKRKTRKKYTSEEKIRIVLEGMRGEESIDVNTFGYFHPANSGGGQHQT